MPVAFFPLAVLLALAMAGLAPFLHRGIPRRLLFLVPLALFAGFVACVPSVVSGAVPRLDLPWAPQIGAALSWRLDGLSLLFALIVTGVGSPVVAYASAYLDSGSGVGRLLGLLFLFMGSMLGLVLSDNGLALFVFWELTSFSSFLLIGFHDDRGEARSAARCALIVTAVGGLALLGAVVLQAQASGTYAVSAWKEASAWPVLLLVGAAAFTKSAQFPFHFWLPRAMEAPAPVSAYLHAATLVNAGIYLLARWSPLAAEGSLWAPMLTWIGAATALVGAVRANAERASKRILAYSTIGALGLMVMLLGLGTPGAVAAALIYLLAHALYKGALFLVAGAVDHATHEPDVERLGRLRTVMPGTAAAGLLAALSMSGVPLFLGFQAKEGVFEAVGASWTLTAIGLVVSALFLSAAFKTGVGPFWRRTSEADAPRERVAGFLWWPPFLLALPGLVFGIGPSWIAGLVEAARTPVVPGGETPDLAAWHGFTSTFLLSLVAIGLGFAAFAGRHVMVRSGRSLRMLGRLGPDRAYELALGALDRLARAQTSVLQRGYLRQYLLVILLTALLLVGFVILGRRVPSVPSLEGARAHEMLVAAVIVVGSMAAVRATSRFTSILSLGAVGYGVALLFLLFGAPDLGLTQLVVESLTILLLVIAFNHLPPFKALSRPAGRVRDAIVAGAFGVLMTLLILSTADQPAPHPVSRFFAEASVPQGHGRNVVNVILTDFRAVDTLGEITVLAVAAVGVLAMLKLRAPGRTP